MAKIYPQFLLLAIMGILLISPLNCHTTPVSIACAVNPTNISLIQNPYTGFGYQLLTPGPNLGITNWTHNHFENPDFEKWNNATSPFQWTHSRTIRSTISHLGAYSANLTSSSDGPLSTAYLNQTLMVWISYHNPGNFSFWWFLNLEQLSQNDVALIQFQLYNYTHYLHLHYYLSYGGASPYSNSSQKYFYHANGFNSTDSWQLFQCNLWEAVSTPFDTTEILVTAFSVSVLSLNPNSQLGILLDDTRLIARAISDAGYEDQADTSQPIQGWNTDISPNFTVTLNAYRGAWAAQCALAPFGLVNLSHDLNTRPLNGTRETYLDVVWGLDSFGSGRIQYSIELNDNKTLHYVFAANDWSEMINDAENAYFNVSRAGTVGTWTQMHRDLVHDYQAAFGFLPNVSVTTLCFFAIAETDPLKIIFDDLYLYDDPPPILSNQQASWTWDNDAKRIYVYAEDQDLEIVSVVFRANGAAWIELAMSPLSDTLYAITTPTRPYNTLVEYYLQARDSWGMISTLLNGTGYFYYRVPDTNSPHVDILWPTSNAVVSGYVEIGVNATDNESGVVYVEFCIDAVSQYNDTTFPYAFLWNSTTVPDGRHSLTARAYDQRGNWEGRSRYVYTDNYPDTLPTPIPFLIVVIGILIIGIQIALLGYLVFRRKTPKDTK